MDFAIYTDIADQDLLFQELEVSAFLVVFVLITTLSGVIINARRSGLLPPVWHMCTSSSLHLHMHDSGYLTLSLDCRVKQYPSDSFIGSWNVNIAEDYTPSTYTELPGRWLWSMG